MKSKKNYFEITKEDFSKLKIDPNIDLEKQYKSICLWLNKIIRSIVEKWIQNNEINWEKVSQLLYSMFWYDVTFQKFNINDVYRNFSETESSQFIMVLWQILNKIWLQPEDLITFNIQYWDSNFCESEKWKFIHLTVSTNNENDRKNIIFNKTQKQWINRYEHVRLLETEIWKTKTKITTNVIEYLYIICVHYFAIQSLLKITWKEEYWEKVYNKFKNVIERIINFLFVKIKAWFWLNLIEDICLIRYKSEEEKFEIKKVFFEILSEWKFYQTSSSYIFKEQHSWDRKEYAKVYQQDNLRLKNQTEDILDENVFTKEDTIKDKEEVLTWTKAIWMFSDKRLQSFVKNFKWLEIDENTNLEDLNKFFIKFYYIIQEIQLYLNKFWVNISQDILPKVFFKIRKLWQYKANWLFFPWNNTLALDIRWRWSVIHELWHMIHFNLWELLWKDKLTFVWMMTNNLMFNRDLSELKKEDENKYNNILKLRLLLKLYTDKSKIETVKKFWDWLQYLIWLVQNCYWWKIIRPDTWKIDRWIQSFQPVYWNEFYKKLLEEYEKVVIANNKYSSYTISSTEIFARFFDLMFQTRLKNKWLQIKYWDFWSLEKFDHFLIWWTFWVFQQLWKDQYMKHLNDFFSAFYYYTFDTFNYLKEKQKKWWELEIKKLF